MCVSVYLLFLGSCKKKKTFWIMQLGQVASLTGAMLREGEEKGRREKEEDGGNAPQNRNARRDKNKTYFCLSQTDNVATSGMLG
jgi:hypothetical protein